MSARAHMLSATSEVPVWWVDDSSGLIGYVGAGVEGIEFRRHSWDCAPGKWSVGLTGWAINRVAVMDDFGNLVEVPR